MGWNAAPPQPRLSDQAEHAPGGGHDSTKKLEIDREARYHQSRSRSVCVQKVGSRAWPGRLGMNQFASTKELQARLDRLQAGEEAARAELLSCACERLRNLTRKMMRDYARLRRWEDSDDVVQNASMRLC